MNNPETTITFPAARLFEDYSLKDQAAYGADMLELSRFELYKKMATRSIEDETCENRSE